MSRARGVVGGLVVALLGFASVGPAQAAPRTAAIRTATPPTATPGTAMPRTVAGGVGAAATRYVASVPQPAGCLAVGPPIVGVKVYLVQKALGLVNHHEVYDKATSGAVTGFQRAHRLAATGVVDQRTWTALNTGYPFCVDRYTAQPTVAPSAPAAAHVAATIGYATARIGLPYIWGGAGPIGFDCSGLSLQALYAGGTVVPGVTTDRHVQATFNTAAAIYHSPALAHVPLAQRRPGDLVFWGKDFHHMALYLGSDTIVEAVRPLIHKASLWSHGTPLPTVVRPTG